MFKRRFLLMAMAVLLFGGMSLLTAAPSKDEQAVQKATESLKSGSPKEKVAALKELGRLGHIDRSLTKASTPAIIDALDDKDVAVRAQAAYTIGLIDPDNKSVVVNKLIKILKDEKVESVREGAAMGLGAMGDDAKDAVGALREARANAGKKDGQAYQNALMQITGKKK